MNDPKYVQMADGRRFVRVREESRVEGPDPKRNSVLYVEIDGDGRILRDNLYFPGLQDPLNPGLLYMHSAPWVSREGFIERGLPPYELPAEPVEWGKE